MEAELTKRQIFLTKEKQSAARLGGAVSQMSRRPSSARISVASSANSRCPPTGIP